MGGTDGTIRRLRRAGVLPVLAALALLLAGVPGAAAAPAAGSSPAPVTETVVRLAGAVSGQAGRVDTGFPFTMVAFSWDAATTGTVVLRTLTAAGWSDWFTADGDPGEGPDAGSVESRARTGTDATWVGAGVRRIEYRVTAGTLPNLELHAIRSEPTAVDARQAAAATSTAASAAGGAGVGAPAIITRAQWGADESWRTFAQGCDGTASYADNVHQLIVHHTDTPNTYLPGDSAAMVRGIYFFHTHTNLWCDIGYNFLVDRYGQVFEGRYGGVAQPVIGAHAGGFNTGSSGISLLGTFDTVAPPPAMYAALRRLAGWEATIHGFNPAGTVTVVAGSFPAAHWPEGTDVTLPTIIGHRDVDSTDCPGALAYAMLPALRRDVGADVGPAFLRRWSGWSPEDPPPPEGASGAPAVSSWGVTRFDQFVQGGDGHLWHRASDDSGATFTDWEDLGAPPGGVASAPAAVSWADSRIDVFVRGGDGALWHLWFDGGPWLGWESLGGVLTSAPAVASWAPGRLDVFADGGDHAIWHKWWSTGWSVWERRGGYGMFDPTATSWGPGRIDVFTVGSDRSLYHSAWDAGWGPWVRDVPGTWASGPAAASWGPGRLDVFVTGPSRERPMVHLWNTGGWHTESLGGTLSAGPAAVSWRYNRVDAFAVGTDGGIWHDTWPGPA